MSHIKFSHLPPGFSRLPLATLLLALAFASAARAQHEDHNMPMPTNSSSPAAGMAANAQESHGMKMEFGPLADSQDASGTAWQPADTSMHAQHSMRGDWMLMMHYNVFLAYNNQSGRRGGEQVNSINWLMLMATKRGAENELMSRGMFSLEPWTTTTKGYPLLLQSGNPIKGSPWSTARRREIPAIY